MVNKDILFYLKEGQGRGFSLNILKQKLIEGGFSEEDVDEAVHELHETHEPKKRLEEKIPVSMTDLKTKRSKKKVEKKAVEETEEKSSGDAFLEQSLKKHEPGSDSFFKSQPYEHINTDHKIRRPSLFNKLGMSFSNPQDLFLRTRHESILPAFLYQLFILILPFLILSVITLFFMDTIVANAPELLGTTQLGVDINQLIVDFSELELFVSMLSITLSIFIGIPLLTFILTEIYHLIIYVFGGLGKYADTYQIAVYGSTPFMLFGLIPFLNFVALLWAIVLHVVGLAETHDMSKVRAFFIILSVIVLGAVIWLGNYAIRLYSD